MESIDPVWLFGAIALATGILLGFLINRLLNPSAGDIDQLKADLQSERAEMERYKASVNTHFNKTSELVNDLTQDYVKVYRHLAEGAQTLSDTREFSHLLEQQKGRVLISVEDRPKPMPAVDADDSAGVSPRPEASDDRIVEDRPPVAAADEAAPAEVDDESRRSTAEDVNEPADTAVGDDDRARAAGDTVETSAEGVADSAKASAGKAEKEDAGKAEREDAGKAKGDDARKAEGENAGKAEADDARKAEGENAGKADDEQPLQPEPRQQQSAATAEADSSKRT